MKSYENPTSKTKTPSLYTSDQKQYTQPENIEDSIHRLKILTKSYNTINVVDDPVIDYLMTIHTRAQECSNSSQEELQC
jgi:hypothetical protein